MTQDDWTPTRRYMPGTADVILERQRASEALERQKREANRPTGTEVAQTSRKLQQVTAELVIQQQTLTEQQKTLADLTSFLTGQQGFAQNDALWADGTDPSGNINPLAFTDYDAKYDCSTTFTALSDTIDIRIAAWVMAKTNAYAADGKSAYGVNTTAAVAFDLLDTDTGATIHQPSAGDAAEAHIETWGTNDANVVGVTTSNTARVTNLTPNHQYTLRTRRGRSGYAHDGPGNVITMPSGGWWQITIGYTRLNITLVANPNQKDNQ